MPVFLLSVLAISGVCSGQSIEVWHADSLAGPMKELKIAFEAKNPGVKVNLVSGRSRELSWRILKGESCDVFAPSDPAVIKDMFGKKLNGKETVSWYVVFSANEMVVITKKGSTSEIRQMSDLCKQGVRVVRVTGETDMATNRTVEFIKKATAAEGKPDLAQKIIDDTAVKANTVPEAVQAIKDGKADAGVVYLSAAVAAGSAVDIVYFPANLNLSDTIRNAATVPGNAANAQTANNFVQYIMLDEGQQVLKKTGQPPVVPPLRVGNCPQGFGQ